MKSKFYEEKIEISSSIIKSYDPIIMSTQRNTAKKNWFILKICPLLILFN